jgi:hypothetical protein
MNSITEKDIAVALAKGKTVGQIVESVLGQNNVTAGSKVTAVSDPSYPYEGIVGTVKGAPDGGFAEVEFPGGQSVKLAVNQLIPVGA